MEGAMRVLKLLPLVGLCVVMGIPRIADCAEKVEIRQDLSKKLVYKNAWVSEYFSKRADVIDKDKETGTVDVRVYGNWISTEQQVDPKEGDPPGTIRIWADIDASESTVTEDGARISLANFPHVMEGLSGRAVSWRMTPDGRLDQFLPEFKTYEITSYSMISDLHQLWMPEYRLGLPSEPVGPGDKWTAEQQIEVPINQIEKKGSVKIKSSYQVKKLKSKDGVKTAEIEENREIVYTGWIFSSAVSIIVNAEGTGKGKWVMDVTNGVVLSHEVKIKFDKVDVTTVDVTFEKPDEAVEDAKAKFKFEFKRKLAEIQE
jgi:hypothetical protein